MASRGDVIAMMARAMDLWREIRARLQRRPAPRIEDVPCGSCQRGYSREHVCELPDFCPCDHAALHVTSPAEHRQVHRPHDGASECTCGEWVGPMTTLADDDPRSFAVHVASVTSPGESGA